MRGGQRSRAADADEAKRPTLERRTTTDRRERASRRPGGVFAFRLSVGSLLAP
jgi:hypothetical protein